MELKQTESKKYFLAIGKLPPNEKKTPLNTLLS